jgi:hypothetical protein
MRVWYIRCRMGYKGRWLEVVSSPTCMATKKFVEGVGEGLGSREGMAGGDGAAAWKELESFNNLPGDLCHHIPCCQVYSTASTGDCAPHD